MQLRFRILNVFTRPGDPFSGNPLCVFEDGTGLSSEQMQALARQFNLSETTFVLPATEPSVCAQVRIFTPTFEMPFAGHPTLGTAHVVEDLLGASGKVTLQMKAGLVEVTAEGDTWTLRTARPPETRKPEPSREAFSEMLGISEASIGDRPLWVDTGSDQLVIPLASPADVEAARPVPALLEKLARSDKRGSSLAYVWARRSAEDVVARFFFLSHGGVVEDPATGSACANLGGWMLATGQPLPVTLHVHQGDRVARPSLLHLHVDVDRNVFVSGAVKQLGRGTIDL